MKQKIAKHNPTPLENLKEVTVNVWVNEINSQLLQEAWKINA